MTFNFIFYKFIIFSEKYYKFIKNKIKSFPSKTEIRDKNYKKILQNQIDLKIEKSDNWM